MHHRILDKFVFETIANTQYKDTDFEVKITAVDPFGEKYEGYSGTNTLSGGSAQISPTSTVFVGGVWQGKVKVLEIESSMSLITTSPDDKTGESNLFKVQDQNTGDLEIIVKNEFGNTIGGASVYCYPPQVTGLPMLWNGTSPDGIVIFKELLASGYTIYASKNGYDASQKIVVAVIPGRTTTTVITLTNPNPENNGVPGYPTAAVIAGIVSAIIFYKRRSTPITRTCP
jgi:hypothetical protein